VSLLHNAIVTIYSQVTHQPSGIRGFWFGVSLLSPLRPICCGITLSRTRETTGFCWEFGFHVLGEFGLFRNTIPRNDNPLLKFLGNAFTGERILQRPTPLHLWATDRPRICYPTCRQLPWCPAHAHTGHVASPTKKPIVMVAADVKKIQTTKKTRGRDVVAKGMMKVHAAH